MKRWNHVISQVDNWIWLLLAVGVLIISKVYDIPALNAVAGACLVKIKGNNGYESEDTNTIVPDRADAGGVRPDV